MFQLSKKKNKLGKMKYNKILYLDKEDNIYSRAIKNELMAKSNIVDCFLAEDIYRAPIFFSKLHSQKLKEIRERRFSQLLEYIKKQNYDFILVKSPYKFPLYFIEEIAIFYNSIPIVNYNWSSIQKFNYLPYQKLFTKIYSFDSSDCKNYGFNYHPLFYLKEFEELQKRENKVYDFSFIGSGYSEGRLEFLDSLLKTNAYLSNLSFLYIFTPGIIDSLRVKLKYKGIAQFCYWKLLSLNEVLNTFGSSKSMIDHPMSIQTGLTMRTFETLGSGLHLYTTNREIINEPFYNENRITVIRDDLKDFAIKGLSSSNSLKSWQDSFTKYRIDNWISVLLEI